MHRPPPQPHRWGELGRVLALVAGDLNMLPEAVRECLQCSSRAIRQLDCLHIAPAITVLHPNLDARDWLIGNFALTAPSRTAGGDLIVAWDGQHAAVVGEWNQGVGFFQAADQELAAQKPLELASKTALEDRLAQLWFSMATMANERQRRLEEEQRIMEYELQVDAPDAESVAPSVAGSLHDEVEPSVLGTEPSELPPDWNASPVSPFSPAGQPAASSQDPQPQAAAVAGAPAASQGEPPAPQDDSDVRFVRRDGLPIRVFVQRQGELYTSCTLDRDRAEEKVREVMSLRLQRLQSAGMDDAPGVVMPWTHVRECMRMHKKAWLAAPEQADKIKEVQERCGDAEAAMRTMTSRYRCACFEELGGVPWMGWVLALGNISIEFVDLVNMKITDRIRERAGRPPRRTAGGDPARLSARNTAIRGGDPNIPALSLVSRLCQCPYAGKTIRMVWVFS